MSQTGLPSGIQDRVRHPSLKADPSKSDLANGASSQKLRGAYFTPKAIAAYATRWAIKSADDRVLEPSCGEAAFLVQAVERLRGLSNDSGKSPLVYGVEIDPVSATVAAEAVRAAGGEPKITVSDFFDCRPRRAFDAVVGNPPFVRFHLHSGEARRKSKEAARRAGVSLSGLASSWAAFVVTSTEFLTQGGRLAMVLPSELLSVDYAADVRQFLLSRFASVEVVSFSSPVFVGVQTDALLVLADGYGGSSQELKMREGADPANLAQVPPLHVWSVQDRRSKWTQGRSTLSWDGDEYPDGFERFSAWGVPSLGVVTGNNGFFAVAAPDAMALSLSATSLRALAPPLRPDARGLDYTLTDWQAARERGKPVWLFSPPEDPDEFDLSYIASGESTLVQDGYKCRNRTPWWSVPAGQPGDLMVTYMSAGVPRIVGNPLGYLHLNSVHRFRVTPQLRSLAIGFLPSATLNSVTALGAERLGRSYGGGVLKLELGELRALPTPTSAVVEAVRPKLIRLRDSLDGLLRSGRGDDAIRLVDAVILRGELGWTRSAVKELSDVATGIRVSRQDRARPRAERPRKAGNSDS